jgi:hypothetical protein
MSEYERLSAELVRETRYRWEPIGDDPPEGWRRCDNATFSEDYLTYSVTYTDAPRNESPFNHNSIWRKYRRITQERYVTPWVDVALLIDGGGA